MNCKANQNQSSFPFPAAIQSVAFGSMLLLGCVSSEEHTDKPVPNDTTPNWVAGDLHVLDDDGAWCWFEDERAVMRDGILHVGTVSAGTKDPERQGDVNLLQHIWMQDSTRVVELHDRLERDDHDSPSLTWLPGGELLAVYAKHGSDSKMRWRTSKSRKVRDFSEERVLQVHTKGSGLTYSNTFWMEELPSGGPGLINFFRGRGWNPTGTMSTDMGDSWSRPSPLLLGPGRPYMRYVSDGQGTVHFAVSEQHPRNFDTGIRHGKLVGAQILDSNDNPIGSFPEQAAMVAHLSTVFTGTADRVAWCNDIRLDGSAQPVITYSVQWDSAGLPVGQGGDDCRYRYARLVDGKWTDHPVAHAGHRLYSKEDDYTGLIGIDPRNVNTVVFSTNADPVSGEPLISTTDGERHWELYRGRTADGGASWAFDAITANSSEDNIRPVFAVGSKNKSIVTWLRGEYTTYQKFDMSVVALALPEGN